LRKTYAKIVVQQILYHSVFGLDSDGHWVNQTVYFLPTDDLYLLAVLNSRVIWWYLSHRWPHLKDDALSVQKPKLLALPMPTPPALLRAEIEELALKARELTNAGAYGTDLLSVETELNERVMKGFALSATDVGVIENSLPPRDPLVVLRSRISPHIAE